MGSTINSLCNRNKNTEFPISVDLDEVAHNFVRTGKFCHLPFGS